MIYILYSIETISTKTKKSKDKPLAHILTFVITDNKVRSIGTIDIRIRQTTRCARGCQSYRHSQAAAERIIMQNYYSTCHKTNNSYII